MKLKEKANIVALLKAAQTAKGDVWFRTDEGDQLNLKSVLSQYVFIAAATDKSDALLAGGKIICDKKQDYALLQEYLESAETV